jgi:hypothetical protein
MHLQKNTPMVWAAVAWTVLIFILLVIPEGNLAKKGFLGLSHLDKVAHVFLFFLFVVLWHQALYPGQRGETTAKMALELSLLSFIYGTGMEFVQALFTSRAFEWLDILADGIGAYAGYLWAVRR